MEVRYELSLRIYSRGSKVNILQHFGVRGICRRSSQGEKSIGYHQPTGDYFRNQMHVQSSSSINHLFIDFPLCQKYFSSSLANSFILVRLPVDRLDCPDLSIRFPH